MTFLGTVLKKLRKKHRDGLLMHLLTTQLANLGIDFRPYVVMQEIYSEETSQQFGSEFDVYDVAWLDHEQMQALDQMDGREETAEKLCRRLDDGNRCLGLMHEGQIVAFTWCDFGPMKHEYLKLQLTSHDAYLFDAHTVQAYRGRNLAPYLRFRCYQTLSTMGHRNFFSFSDYFNTPALRFKKKLNASWLKLVLRIRFFKLIDTKWVLKNYAPDIEK